VENQSFFYIEEKIDHRVLQEKSSIAIISVLVDRPLLGRLKKSSNMWLREVIGDGLQKPLLPINSL
jgi:hypothetical protein